MGDIDICPQTEGRFAGDGKGDNLWDYWYQVELIAFASKKDLA